MATRTARRKKKRTFSRAASDVKHLSVVSRSLDPELSGTQEESPAGHAEPVDDGGGGVIQLGGVVRVRPLQRRALESKEDMQRDLAVNGLSVVSSTGSCALPQVDDSDRRAQISQRS